MRNKWASCSTNGHLNFNADLLGLDADRVARLIAARGDREFVYLQRHVAPGLADKVRALSIGGVYLDREYRRYYPLGEISAHVVGFTNVDDVGQEGLELYYEDTLKGLDGSKRVIRDRLGKVIRFSRFYDTPAGSNDILGVSHVSDNAGHFTGHCLTDDVGKTLAIVRT